VLVLALTVGSIYFIQSAGRKKEIAAAQISSPGPSNDAVVALSKQNSLRIKWDLAMKYMESGLYDKSIRELNGILEMDPANEDARKFLELVEQKKSFEEKQKLDPAPDSIPAAQAPPRPATKGAKPALQPMPAELEPVKTTPVEFEFEHGFPSGSMYIFANEKLAFEGSLSGEEKKVLMFRNYKGKLTGTLQVPLGETILLVHVVCMEKGISASKRITVNVTDGHHSLSIKYLKSPKQLELKWT